MSSLFGHLGTAGIVSGSLYNPDYELLTSRSERWRQRSGGKIFADAIYSRVKIGLIDNGARKRWFFVKSCFCSGMEANLEEYPML